MVGYWLIVIIVGYRLLGIIVCLLFNICVYLLFNVVGYLLLVIICVWCVDSYLLLLLDMCW